MQDVWLLSLLHEALQEGCRLFRNTADLVCGLPIELEVQLCLWASIVPRIEGLELAASEPALGIGGSFDGDTDPWRLALDADPSWGGFGPGYDATGNKARAALVFASEDEDSIAFVDALAAIHRLLRREGPEPGVHVNNFSLDHVHGARLFGFCVVQELERDA